MTDGDRRTADAVIYAYKKGTETLNTTLLDPDIVPFIPSKKGKFSSLRKYKLYIVIVLLCFLCLAVGFGLGDYFHPEVTRKFVGDMKFIADIIVWIVGFILALISIVTIWIKRNSIIAWCKRI